MKKVLFVSYVNLYPINEGNRVRVTNLIDSMRKMGHDVYYVHYGRHIGNYDKRRMIEYMGKDHCWFYRGEDYSWISRIHSRQREHDGGRSVYYDVDEVIPHGLLKYVKKIHKKLHFDVVIAEYVMSSKVLTIFDKSVLKVIDTHDILTERNKIFERLQLNTTEFTGYYLRKWQEIRGLRRADVVIAIQDKEAETFKKWLKNKRVYVIGNKVKGCEPHIANNKNVLFVGNNNLLNKGAVDYCIKNLVPILEQNGAKFMMAGKVCDYFPDSELYEKVGFVEDLSELYRNVRVVVNPIQGGTGLNIKSIEALGYAKPLVTNSIGAKGLPKNVLIMADRVEDFCQKVMQLLEDDSMVYDLSLKAHKFVSRYNFMCEKGIENVLELKKGSR